MGWAHQPAGGDREIVAPGTTMNTAGYCMKVTQLASQATSVYQANIHNINQTVSAGNAVSPTLQWLLIVLTATTSILKIVWKLGRAWIHDRPTGHRDAGHALGHGFDAIAPVQAWHPLRRSYESDFHQAEGTSYSSAPSLGASVETPEALPEHPHTCGLLKRNRKVTF